MLLRLLKYLIVVAFTLVALFFGFVTFIDQEKFIQKINDKIRSDFGKEIQYDHKIDLNFFPFPQIKLKNIKYFDKKGYYISFVSLRVSLIRPAPYELPQGRNAARVIGCSGAI